MKHQQRNLIPHFSSLKLRSYPRARSRHGVLEDYLVHLFRPFNRIDDTRDPQTGGTGLGLAITERAVRLHGGTVSATNAPGGGLLVELRLPTDGHRFDSNLTRQLAL